MPIEIKICGLTTPDAVRAAVQNDATYVGFVFYPPSPRSITPARANELVSGMKRTSKTVAVLVDPDDDKLRELFSHFEPDLVQLHGKETVERVRQIRSRFGKPVIKAFTVQSAEDIAQSQLYATAADYFLFDAKPPKNSTLPGGNGVCFDWSLLHAKPIAQPWFLSGGLTSGNLAEAVKQSGANKVDVSSSLESAPGVKDSALINAFTHTARTIV